MRHDAVIIEVGLNEAVTPATQPHVPQQPSECAADARRCADAGAAIVHWHAIDAAGVPRLADADLYGTTLDEIAGCVLAYPSYPTDVPDTVDARLAHCLTLRAHHHLELGPLDVSTVNLVLWDPATAHLAPLEPLPGYDVIRNSLPFVTAGLSRYYEVGLVPTVAAFDVGSTRTIAALLQAGLLREPALIKIFLWGTPRSDPSRASKRSSYTSGNSRNTSTSNGWSCPTASATARTSKQLPEPPSTAEVPYASASATTPPHSPISPTPRSSNTPPPGPPTQDDRSRRPTPSANASRYTANAP
jgi:hypothetical protein